MNTETLQNYTGGFIALTIIGIVLFIVLMDGGKKAEIDKKIEELASNTLEMTPEEFFKMRKTSFDSHHSSYAMEGRTLQEYTYCLTRQKICIMSAKENRFLIA